MSTKPAAIRLTRTGATSSARVAINGGSAAVAVEARRGRVAAAAAAGAAHEDERAAGPDLAGGVARDLERQSDVVGDALGAPDPRPSPAGARSWAGPAVTITWSTGPASSSKNRFRRSGSVASKAAVLRAPTSCAAPLEALGVAAGEDDVGALGAGAAERSRARSRRCRRSRTTVCPLSSAAQPHPRLRDDRLGRRAICPRSAFSAST